MKMNKHIVKLICPSSSGSLLADHCSGDFLNYIGRAALLAVVLGVAVVFATGCSSTGNGFNPLLIKPASCCPAEFGSRGERLESNPAEPRI